MTDSIFLSGIFEQGYGFSPKIVMRDKNLTIEAKAIYAYLSSYSGTGFASFPSVDLLCHDLGITRQRYTKHRKLLETYGYLTVTQERGETGFNRNIYKLNASIPENVGLRNVTSQNVTTENVTSQNNTTNSNSLNNNNLKSNSLVSKGAKEFDFSKWPNEPSDEAWADFVSMRKAKKAQITQRVINTLGNEITKAAKQFNMSADDCLDEAVARGWQSFKAAWVERDRTQNKGKHQNNAFDDDWDQFKFRGQTV